MLHILAIENVTVGLDGGDDDKGIVEGKAVFPRELKRGGMSVGSQRHDVGKPKADGA